MTTKQAIAGVTPAEVDEVAIITVWPSVSRYALGRLHGRLYANTTGWYIFTVGNLIALLSIPGALLLYFLRIAPVIGVRYKLTNRRIIVLRGLAGKVEERSLPLVQFDTIDLEVQSGQDWYDAGDLVFRRRDGVEAFRLEAVSRPRAFEQICRKAHMSRVGVLKVRQHEAVAS